MDLKLLGLVNKHYRDIVFNWIKKPAVIADQAVPVFIQPYIPFALGTGEYLKKLIADSHYKITLPHIYNKDNYI